MIELEKYLEEHQYNEAQPEKGQTGEESQWLHFGDFPIISGKLWAGDAQFAPSPDDGVMVDVPTGTYDVAVKLIHYGEDTRVSRLRAWLSGTNPTLGAEVGETWADTGTQAFCDQVEYDKECGEDFDAYWERVEEVISGHDVAIVALSDNAAMPFVQSGFGDGEFKLFELLESGSRVGVELEMIGANEPYPFDLSEEQEEDTVNEA